MLDIPTPQVGQITQAFFRRLLDKSSRRLYSRLILGLSLPGRYYFITWTSSPQSPPIARSWHALQRWLHRKRPGSTWCYCITDEGHGVIHLVIRLGKKEKRLNVNEVRAHWTRLHKARQIRIVYVEEPKDLAAYLSDQRRKRRIAGEFAWQDMMVRWNWSRGWLPKGFTRAFGRAWYEWSKISDDWVREAAIGAWLLRIHQGLDTVDNPPRGTA